MKERRRRELIDKRFGGDVARYETEMEALRQAEIANRFGGDAEAADAQHNEARQYTIYWQDIADAAIILPEWEAAAHELIVRRLGYLTHESCMLEYEPFLRALLQQQQSDLLTDNAFTQQVEEHLVRLRNEDMQRGDWVTRLSYTDEDYARYDTYLVPYKHTVRDRIAGCLGYEPDLLHSLEAELWFRDFLSRGC